MKISVANPDTKHRDALNLQQTDLSISDKLMFKNAFSPVITIPDIFYEQQRLFSQESAVAFYTMVYSKIFPCTLSSKCGKR